MLKVMEENLLYFIKMYKLYCIMCFRTLECLCFFIEKEYFVFGCNSRKHSTGSILYSYRPPESAGFPQFDRVRLEVKLVAP